MNGKNRKEDEPVLLLLLFLEDDGFAYQAIEQHQEEDPNPQKGDARPWAKIGVIRQSDAGDDRSQGKDDGEDQRPPIGDFGLQSGGDGDRDQRRNHQSPDRLRRDSDHDRKKQGMGQGHEIGFDSLDFGFGFIVDGREDLLMEEEIEQNGDRA